MYFYFLIFIAVFANATNIKEVTPTTITTDFEQREMADNTALTQNVMNSLGAKALFNAKITNIKQGSLETSGNTTYFKLPNGIDICRQVFIKEFEYTVHTKCYRGTHILLNYVSKFNLD